MSYYEYSDIVIDIDVVSAIAGEKLTPQANGDWPRVTNEDAVKNSIKNIVNTLKGGRRMLPQFASNVYSLLFEPIDDTTSHAIKRIFIDNIQFWDDRVQIIDFSVIPEYDNNLYKCLLNYRIKGSKDLKTLNWVFRRL